MRTIDLNADLGELDDGLLDAAVMPFISSCSIACGAHAGTPETMRRTVRLAKKYGVAIGAHPGYPDRENFGRVSMVFQTEELCELIQDQVLLLRKIAAEEGAAVGHVKLHGALYNDLAFDYERSAAVAEILAEIDPELRFIVFSNSETARAAEDAGLTAVHEVFADRAYTAAGRLKPRSEPGAVLHDEEECLKQAARFVRGETGLPADSICVHGDNPSAIQFVSRLRNFFESQKMIIRPSGHLEFSFRALGKTSLLAKLPPRISKSTHRRIRALQRALKDHDGILEFVPCYAELKIDFDPQLLSFETLKAHIQSLELSPSGLPEPRIIEVPVVYEGEDLKRVAEHNGIAEGEVIRLHSEAAYLVYMLGFSPGFAYLGGLNPKLATPRLETPRVSVPAGSVGIAGNQTGIYPVESPGGWNIIGRTPLDLFDPASASPFLFEAGDEVRFVPILEGDAPPPPNRSCGADPAAPFIKRSVKIIEPGMYTTLQDAGRFGYLQYGLPPSGAMDRPAFEAANALLGNDLNCAVLECTGTMPVLEFSEAVNAAVVYADHYEVREISGLVNFDPIKNGYRAYIAIEGGFDVPKVMGSRSTYVPGKLGGFEGRPLMAGDMLPAGCVEGVSCSDVREEPAVQTGAGCSICIRVIPGPEADWFDCGGLNTFLTAAFSVSSKSDRTGIRLEGPVLSFRHDEQMVSSGIAFGTIQVPPSGQPMILTADHPTTGGYPRLGNVAADDLPALAQLRPGDVVRFIEGR